jgi:DeoR-like helix-turn-helix domain
MSQADRELLGTRTRFERWLHLPDPGALYAVLGATAANMLDGDPVWLLLVGPPSGGKSELIAATGGLDFVRPAATLTEAALLSGTPKKETARDSKGGLLREIGDFGVIACKDFGSILSMPREPRARVLAALREIYDGAWTRLVGSDGGRALHWSGKVGLIAGCTPAVDRHHAVIGAMGERFLFYRLAAEDSEQAERALEIVGHEAEMREDLRGAVHDLFDRRGLTDTQPLREPERSRLIALTTLVVRARSAVERDSYSREVELVPEPEGPARLVKVLERMLAGMDAIGVDREDAWRVVAKAALDCIPAIRRSALWLLRERGALTTRDVAEVLDYPTATARRALEDLTAHGIASRSGDRGRSNRWALTEWARGRLTETFSEMSSYTVSGSVIEIDDIPGKPVGGGES